MDAVDLAPHGVPYAGFRRRFAAYALDYLIVVVADLAVIVTVGAVRVDPALRLVELALLYLAIPWLYAASMWSSPWQATFGKRALGLKVTDLEGERITFGRATRRYFGQILTALTFGYGYAMAVFTPRRQTVHDRLAGTLVVHARWSPVQIAAAPPAAEVSEGRIAAVVLALFLCNPTSVGVLAGIGVPAYQDYALRAQVTTGLDLAATYRTAVSDAVSRGEPLGSLSTESLGLSASSGTYVSRIDVIRGVVAIRYGNAANAAIAGKTLLLIPYRRVSQPFPDLTWVCGHASPPPGMETSVERGATYTTVADAYLPRSCRP